LVSNAEPVILEVDAVDAAEFSAENAASVISGRRSGDAKF